MSVKVILRQSVPNLGEPGDVKEVTPGYFRNFLQPRGMAVEATKGQIAMLEATSSVREGQLAKSRERTSTVADRLEGVTLRIPVKVGEQGRIYGSVTNRDLAEALQTQANVEVDRHRIELRDPLKSIGVHSVPIKLEHGIEAQVAVELVPESESDSALA
jgi:large subunit ribosomal protein L9